MDNPSPNANNISRWAIKNPIPVLLLFVLLTIAGISGFSSMLARRASIWAAARRLASA